MTEETPDQIEEFGETDNCNCCKGAVPLDMFEIMINGVFAFVMTLIVKNNIPLPSAINGDDFAFIASYVSQIFSESVNFIFTFSILAVFYILFFEMMRCIRVIDRYFIYISFGFILSIIFIPLTSLLWTFSDIPWPYGVLFHINVLCCGLIMYFLWRHASTNQWLLVPGLSDKRARNISLRMLLFPATAIAGLLIDGSDFSFGTIDITRLYLVPIILFVFFSRDSLMGSDLP